VPVATKPAYRSRAAFADLTAPEQLARLQVVDPTRAAGIEYFLTVAWQAHEAERRSRQARASLTRRLAAAGARE
jgi:hypothetical protein